MPIKKTSVMLRKHPIKEIPQYTFLEQSSANGLQQWLKVFKGKELLFKIENFYINNSLWKLQFEGNSLPSLEAMLATMDAESIVTLSPIRNSMLVKPEREDLLSGFGGTFSPNTNGVVVIPGVANQTVKVWAAGYEILVAGLHYYYFGTSSTPPGLPSPKVFLVGSAVGRNRQTFTNPMNTGAAGDGLWLYAAVNDANMPADGQAVVE